MTKETEAQRNLVWALQDRFGLTESQACDVASLIEGGLLGGGWPGLGFEAKDANEGNLHTRIVAADRGVSFDKALELLDNVADYGYPGEG
jgi:hypothetical protein